MSTAGMAAWIWSFPTEVRSFFVELLVWKSQPSPQGPLHNGDD